MMTVSAAEYRQINGVVRGDVQGVGFRAFARRCAQQRGLSGWVRNLGDGSVEFLVEGENSILVRFLADLRCGPPGSWVADLIIITDEPIAIPQLTAFSIAF